MAQNFEYIDYPKLKHVKIILNQIMFCSPHAHNDFEIAFLLKGKGHIKIENKMYDMVPGDVFLINAYEKHSYYSFSKELFLSQEEFQENLPLLLIFQISNHFLREYNPILRTTLFKSCKLDEFLDKDLYSKCKTFLIDVALKYFEGKPFFQFEIISELSTLFLRLFEKIPYKQISEEERENLKKRNNRLEKIISYIDENLTSKIKLEDLAELEGLTATHISHIFTNTFEISFRDYLNMKRLEQSILLMEDKSKKLIDIAYESGFSDPKYMNQMFKKYFNCKPKDFKRLDNPYTHVLIHSINSNKKEENLFNDEMAIKQIVKYKELL